jgi:hypothetical protein
VLSLVRLARYRVVITRFVFAFSVVSLGIELNLGSGTALIRKPSEGTTHLRGRLLLFFNANFLLSVDVSDARGAGRV